MFVEVDAYFAFLHLKKEITISFAVWKGKSFLHFKGKFEKSWMVLNEILCPYTFRSQFWKPLGICVTLHTRRSSGWFFSKHVLARIGMTCMHEVTCINICGIKSMLSKNFFTCGFGARAQLLNMLNRPERLFPLGALMVYLVNSL